MTGRVNKTKQSAKKKQVAIVVIVILIGSIIFELSPFGGNTRFYAAWISCGQKPVASDVSIGLGAKVSHYVEPGAFEPFRFGQPEYFCTPIEAEMAGYSASPDRYVFPNIKQDQS